MTGRILLIALALAVAPSLLWVEKSAAGNPSGAMSVQVRGVTVRTTPNYLAKGFGDLHYGDQVTVTGEQGNWYQIDSPSGWIPKSALTKHKLKLDTSKGFAKSNVSHDEVALAGKGFNPQVEAQFRKNNSSLASAYMTIDRVEKFGATDAELNNFQRSGNLQPK